MKNLSGAISQIIIVIISDERKLKMNKKEGIERLKEINKLIEPFGLKAESTYKKNCNGDIVIKNPFNFRAFGGDYFVITDFLSSITELNSAIKVAKQLESVELFRS